MTTTLTTATFDEAVAGTDLPALVDVTASWVRPCRMMAPVLAERAATLVVAEVDVDADTELARRFDVMSMPTFLLQGGVPIARFVGARPEARLAAEIDDALRPVGPVAR